RVRDTERPFLATTHGEPHDVLCDGHLDVWDRDRRPRVIVAYATDAGRSRRPGPGSDNNARHTSWRSPAIGSLKLLYRRTNRRTGVWRQHAYTTARSDRVPLWRTHCGVKEPSSYFLEREGVRVVHTPSARQTVTPTRSASCGRSRKNAHRVIPLGERHL